MAERLPAVPTDISGLFEEMADNLQGVDSLNWTPVSANIFLATRLAPLANKLIANYKYHAQCLDEQDGTIVLKTNGEFRVALMSVTDEELYIAHRRTKLSPEVVAAHNFAVALQLFLDEDKNICEFLPQFLALWEQHTRDELVRHEVAHLRTLAQELLAPVSPADNRTSWQNLDEVLTSDEDKTRLLIIAESDGPLQITAQAILASQSRKSLQAA